jgi:hypothetical protein
MITGVLAVVLVVYAVFGVFMWRTMHRSPEDFARVMARLPQPAVFLIFPFETFWMHARAGTLAVGDAAPDFLLTKLDKSGTVHLTEVNATQPVVLVFGSYT